MAVPDGPDSPTSWRAACQRLYKVEKDRALSCVTPVHLRRLLNQKKKSMTTLKRHGIGVTGIQRHSLSLSKKVNVGLSQAFSLVQHHWYGVRLVS